MFIAFPTLVIVASIAHVASGSTGDLCSPGDQVAIRVTGELAEKYVDAVAPLRTPKSFLNDGSLAINGIVHSVDNGQLQIRCRELVTKVGQPVRIVTFRSTIDVNLISVIAADKSDSVTRFRAELSDSRQAELRSVMLRGDFPVSVSRSYY